MDWALHVFKSFLKRNFLAKIKPMHLHAKNTNKNEKNRTNLPKVPNWTAFLFGFNCLAVRPSVSRQLEEEPKNLVPPSITEFATKTLASPSRLFGMFAHLLCQQKVYHPIRKDSYIGNKPIAFLTGQIITRVLYHLLCMITVLMKLFWCENQTGQDK